MDQLTATFARHRRRLDEIVNVLGRYGFAAWAEPRHRHSRREDRARARAGSQAVVQLLLATAWLPSRSGPGLRLLWPGPLRQ